MTDTRDARDYPGVEYLEKKDVISLGQDVRDRLAFNKYCVVENLEEYDVQLTPQSIAEHFCIHPHHEFEVHGKSFSLFSIMPCS